MLTIYTLFYINGLSEEAKFSAAPTAQNSPELHFRFINYFIQPSRVGSLAQRYNSQTLSKN